MGLPTFDDVRELLEKQFETVPRWEKKCWGWVWHLHVSDEVAVSFLMVEKGYRSSWHKHRQRTNMFAVIAGEVLIEKDAKVGNIMTNPITKYLASGQTYTVPPNVYHRFRVIESGMMVEVYTIDAKVKLNDIERLDVGGSDDTNT